MEQTPKHPPAQTYSETLHHLKLTDFESARAARNNLLREMEQVELSMMDDDLPVDKLKLLAARKRHIEGLLSVIRRFLEDSRNDFQATFYKVVEDYGDVHPSVFRIFKEETKRRMDGERARKYSNIHKNFK